MQYIDERVLTIHHTHTHHTEKTEKRRLRRAITGREGDITEQQG